MPTAYGHILLDPRRRITTFRPLMRIHVHERAKMSPGPRPLWRSLLRGFRCRCPNCGEGAIFRGYLKPLPECPVCREDFTPQRADDFPPYVTIVVVGHLLVPILLAVQLTVELHPYAHLAIWLPLTAVATVALLRPVKGAIIALQWALRMHGFDGNPDPDRFTEYLGSAPAAPRPPQSPR
jgi:uncharacterized protein (DUF983 family)